MPLAELPAAAGSLNAHPPRTLAGTELVRVWRKHLPNQAVRTSPWWFASAPGFVGELVLPARELIEIPHPDEPSRVRVLPYDEQAATPRR